MLQIFSQRHLMLASLTFRLLALDYLIFEVLFEERCQDTILGGAEAQTRFEAASKQSNDLPLSRVNILGSGEDSMKLKELMEHCTQLSKLATSKVKTVNGECQIQALVDKKKVIITETSIRSDLHLEDADGTDCLPTATIFEELARMGSTFLAMNLVALKAFKKQSKRKQKKNTKVPHPSDFVADVPNEEHVPTHSNDLLLSGEDRMKLIELMDMCTKLSERVLDLEHTKTAQAQEITNLKLRVKELEKKAGFRTHNFDRLYKVGVTKRVESSDDESLGAQEDASKQGRSRIEAINRDAEVTLVETQRRNDENDENYDNLMFDTGVFDGDEIVVETEEHVINAATTTKSILIRTMVSTATTTVVATPTITTPPQQRAKGIAFREPVESTRAAKEEASRAAIYEEWDNEQAMMETDYELAANLQENEREAMPIEEKSRRLAELIRERKKFFAVQRLKDKNFDEVHKIFEKHMKWINSFVPMEEDLPSEKVQKEVSSEKKTKGNSRKKSISRKRAKDKQEQESSKRQKRVELIKRKKSLINALSFLKKKK
ncbi:hypothetical protein Tco_0256911 [Tanacetum coccineum]